MVPFYETTTDNTVTCKFSGITQPRCTYFPSGMLANGQSYVNFERVDVEFESIPTGSGDRFQLLIPMSTTANKADMHVYLAMLQDNDNYDVNSGMVEVLAAYRLNGGENLRR